MFTEIFSKGMSQPIVPKEGDLYKEIIINGKTFRLLYGYYEDFERHSQYNEPIPIYPDFIKHPIYTDDGVPFVTAMQDVCREYDGKRKGDSCSDCIYFQKSEDLFGLCKCSSRRNSKIEEANVLNE